MDNKYIAIVYEKDMNDVLRKANVIDTFQGICLDDNGKYKEMPFYELGFDYPIWKELKDNRIDISYIDDEEELFSLSNGRCTNHNVHIKMKDIIANELALSIAIREQMDLRSKYLPNINEYGIAEYTEKKSKIVSTKKAASLVALDNDMDLMMPFREIKVGSTEGKPLFIYLHDKKSRGSSNSTMLLKECHSTISALKTSGLEYTLIVPNVVTSYGTLKRVDGKMGLTQNDLNKLLSKVINYEINVNKVDINRIYIMGAGSGVADVLSELETNGRTYAAAILTFGMGFYYDVDKYKHVVFEVASASADMDYAEEEISNMVEELKDAGAKVTYTEFEGKVPQAAKAFFKESDFISNIFKVTREDAVTEMQEVNIPLRS